MVRPNHHNENENKYKQCVQAESYFHQYKTIVINEQCAHGPSNYKQSIPGYSLVNKQCTHGIS